MKHRIIEINERLNDIEIQEWFKKTYFYNSPNNKFLKIKLSTQILKKH